MCSIKCIYELVHNVKLSEMYTSTGIEMGKSLETQRSRRKREVRLGVCVCVCAEETMPITHSLAVGMQQTATQFERYIL